VFFLLGVEVRADQGVQNLDVPDDAMWSAVEGAMTLIAADKAWSVTQGSAKCVLGHSHDHAPGFFLLRPAWLSNRNAGACLTVFGSYTTPEHAFTGSQGQELGAAHLSRQRETELYLALSNPLP
jgi:hypothetical protein